MESVASLGLHSGRSEYDLGYPNKVSEELKHAKTLGHVDRALLLRQAGNSFLEILLSYNINQLSFCDLKLT